MDEIVKKIESIVPLEDEHIQLASQNMVAGITKLAELDLRAKTPDLDRNYSGVERKAMIAKRALYLGDQFVLTAGIALWGLVEEWEKWGEYHPDLGNPQEVIDDLLTKGRKHHIAQGAYIVRSVFPEIVRRGIANIKLWMSETSYTKLRDLKPEFEAVLQMNDITEADRTDQLRNLVERSKLSLSEIRRLKFPDNPKNFVAYEYDDGDTWTWVIHEMGQIARDWMVRRIQPYGTLGKGLEGDSRLKI
tara:strand:+ start:921 stop:1661 length:741 start_codon:yes stop_codon:yes gene_type:complete